MNRPSAADDARRLKFLRPAENRTLSPRLLRFMNPKRDISLRGILAPMLTPNQESH